MSEQLVRPRPLRILPLSVGAAIAVSALAGCSASQPQSEPTSPSAASEVDPDLANAQAFTACLEDRGWNPQIDATGQITFPDSIPEEQADQFFSDNEECEAPLREDTPELSEYTPAMWRDLYTKETHTAECLRGEGLDIPQIPTEQAFVDQYQSTQPWTSYGFVGNVGSSKWGEINGTCPQP